LRYSRALTLIGIMLLMFIGGLVFFGMPAAAESNPPVLMFDVAGNTRTSAEKILGVITKTRIGEPVNSATIQTDLQAIMDLGYYTDVQVKGEKFLNGIKLVFIVVENPLFKEVKITGLTKVDPNDLEKMFTQKSGEVFNTVTFRKDLNNIKKYCRDQKGLFLDDNIKGDISVDGVINLELIELRVGKIKIVGLQKTKEFVVTRELLLKEGDIFDYNLVKESYWALARLRLFDSIDPKMEAGSAPNTLDLIIEVKEASTGSFQIGASYSENNESIGCLLVFSEDNLMGLGQSFSLDTNISDDEKDISFTFSDPWLDKKGTSFRLSVWNSDVETSSTMNNWTLSTAGTEIGDHRGTVYDVDLIRTGLQMSFGRRLKWLKNTTARAKVTFEKNYITDIWDYDERDEDTDSTYTIVNHGKYADEFWDNSLGFELVRNRLQNEGRFFTKGGYQLMGSYTVAGTYMGGEFNYQSGLLDGRWFRTVAPNLVFGTRLQFAWIDGNYPDYDALYLGGMNRLRGYDSSRYDSEDTKNLIGSSYALSNTELRYRLPSNKSLEFVLFYDAGQITDSGSSRLKSDYGVGLRYEIPFLGLLRLDQAWNCDGDKKIVISLGEIF
jgi:outer membrane protein insertion porin family